MGATVTRYLGLLREIVISQFKLRDQSTIFGFLWSFLHPLSMVLVLFAFFRARLGHDIEHYAIYLLIGIIHYTHFSASTGMAMMVLASMRQITCNAILPREVLILGCIIVHTVDFILSMTLCVVIAAMSGIALSTSLLLAPLILLAQTFLTLWLSIFLAALYVYVRDTAHLWQVFLRILFFITPIFYAVTAVPSGPASLILDLNPLTYLIAASRALILHEGAFPYVAVSGLLLGNLLLTGVALRWFRRNETILTEHM